MRGQRLLAIHRGWLLERLREVSAVKIPDDAEISDLHYLPLTQDIIMTISSATFADEKSYLQTHAQFH